MLVLLRYVIHLLLGLAAFLCLIAWCAQATIMFPFWLWLLSALVGCWLVSLAIRYHKEQGRVHIRSLGQFVIRLVRSLSCRWRSIGGLALLIVLFSTILTACLVWAAGGLVSLLQALHLVVLLAGFFASTALLGLSYERPSSPALPTQPQQPGGSPVSDDQN